MARTEPPVEPIPGMPWPDANGRPNPSSAEGEILRFGDLARGLRTNPRGVARAKKMLIGLAVAIAVLVVLSLALGQG